VWQLEGLRHVAVSLGVGQNVPLWKVLMMGYPVSNKSQGIVGAYMVICINNGHARCELLLGIVYRKVICCQLSIRDLKDACR
jgi:hypothetical protein